MSRTSGSPCGGTWPSTTLPLTGTPWSATWVEHVGREIIRRWLKGIEPELWHHQGRHSPQKWLTQFAVYQPGEGYRQGAPFGDEENTRAFHSGRWVLKPGDDDSPGPVNP